MVTSPAISQWPVVESLPNDFSASLPTTLEKLAEGTPAISVICPNPNLSNVGSRNGPTDLDTLLKVFAFSSPYSFASGAAPTPRESITNKTHFFFVMVVKPFQKVDLPYHRDQGQCKNFHLIFHLSILLTKLCQGVYQKCILFLQVTK